MAYWCSLPLPSLLPPPQMKMQLGPESWTDPAKTKITVPYKLPLLGSLQIRSMSHSISHSLLAPREPAFNISSGVLSGTKAWGHSISHSLSHRSQASGSMGKKGSWPQNAMETPHECVARSQLQDSLGVQALYFSRETPPTKSIKEATHWVSQNIVDRLFLQPGTSFTYFHIGFGSNTRISPKKTKTYNKRRRQPFVSSASRWIPGKQV